jgi:RNA polymerase sigma-70 factor (subfamily 1)
MCAAVEHPDGGLVRRFRDGDEEAFRVLFAHGSPTLAGAVRRRLPDRIRRRISVSDVLQDVALVAFRRRREFTGADEEAFRRWLLGIARHKVQGAIDRHTGKARRSVLREITRDARVDTGQFVGRQPSPSQQAIGAELGALARRALASLPAHYREVLHLVREQQMTLREVAERTGRSREATKKLYGRALWRFIRVFDRLRGGSDA